MFVWLSSSPVLPRIPRRLLQLAMMDIDKLFVLIFKYGIVSSKKVMKLIRTWAYYMSAQETFSGNDFLKKHRGSFNLIDIAFTSFWIKEKDSIEFPPKVT